MRTNRAIFLGSFNPPHNGHLNCLRSVINSEAYKRLDIDKIHVIPCFQNPNKNVYNDPKASYWQRYNMCKLEFASLNENVVIDDIEYKLVKDNSPLYTYQLIEYFKSDIDNIISKDFWWIITVETLKEIQDGKWKNWQNLLENNNFIIIDKRGDRFIIPDNCNIEIVELEENPNANMHSTQLREMIKNNEDVYPYINLGTQVYINQNKIYK